MARILLVFIQFLRLDLMLSDKDFKLLKFIVLTIILFVNVLGWMRILI